MASTYSPAQHAKNRKAIWTLVRKNNRMTMAQIASELHFNRDTVRRYVDALVESGKVYRAGKAGVFPSKVDFNAWVQERNDRLLDKFTSAPLLAIAPYDKTKNNICTLCRNSEPMRRVLAFYRPEVLA